MELLSDIGLAMFIAGSLLAGFTLGLAGAGAGPVALAVWLHFLSPSIAAPVLLLCVGGAQVQSFLVVRKAFDWHKLVPFFIGGLAGIPLGLAILLRVSPEVLTRGIGAFLIVYTTYLLAARRTVTMERGGKLADGGAGLAAGVACGAAGLPGPLITLWCSIRGWSKDVQRATFQPFNFVIVIAGALAFALQGLVTRDVLLLAAIGFPAMLAGAMVGTRLYHKADDRQYRMIVHVMLLISGLSLVFRF